MKANDKYPRAKFEEVCKPDAEHAWNDPFSCDPFSCDPFFNSFSTPLKKFCQCVTFGAGYSTLPLELLALQYFHVLPTVRKLFSR